MGCFSYYRFNHNIFYWAYRGTKETGQIFELINDNCQIKINDYSLFPFDWVCNRNKWAFPWKMLLFVRNWWGVRFWGAILSKRSKKIGKHWVRVMVRIRFSVWSVSVSLYRTRAIASWLGFRSINPFNTRLVYAPAWQMELCVFFCQETAQCHRGRLESYRSRESEHDCTGRTMPPLTAVCGSRSDVYVSPQSTRFHSSSFNRHC